MPHIRVLVLLVVAVGIVSAAAAVAQSEDGADSSAPKSQLPADWPSITEERTVHPQDLQRSALELRRRIECLTCKGKGQITTRKRVGWREGGHFKHPIYEESTSDCGRCDGTGYGDWAKVKDELTKLTAAICDLNTTEKDAGRILGVSMDVLKQLLAHNPKALTQLLNRGAQSDLRNGIGSPGDIVILVVEDTSQRIPGAGNGARVFKFMNPDGRVLVYSPKLISPGAGTAIVGGRLAGFRLDHPHGHVPIMQHGFVIYAK